MSVHVHRKIGRQLPSSLAVPIGFVFDILIRSSVESEAIYHFGWPHFPTILFTLAPDNNIWNHIWIKKIMRSKSIMLLSYLNEFIRFSLFCIFIVVHFLWILNLCLFVFIWLNLSRLSKTFEIFGMQADPQFAVILLSIKNHMSGVASKKTRTASVLYFE